MEKLKERITENGIDYILVGDYYIPDLKLPKENRPIGRYGRLHREYLGTPCTVQLPYPDREIMDIPCRPERAGRGTAGLNHGADEGRRGSDQGTESQEPA